MKKVAIALSCYNHQDFLRKAIKSIINQTYKNWELFFFDNNSTDYSLRVATVYKEDLKDKMNICRFNFCDSVLPIGIARHLMMQRCFESDADYIAILDADDYWRKDKLEKQVKLFESMPDIKLVFSDCYYEYWTKEMEQQNGFMIWTEEIKGTVLDRTFHYKYPPLMDAPFENLLLKYNFMPCPTLMFDREALQRVIGNPMHYTAAEDYDWILKMTLPSYYRCAYIDEPLAYYRIHSDQLTKKTPIRCTMEEIDVVKRFLPHSKANWFRKFWRMFILYLKLIYKEILC